MEPLRFIFLELLCRNLHEGAKKQKFFVQKDVFQESFLV